MPNFSELPKSFTPAAVQAYLQTQGWVQDGSLRDVATIWHRADSPDAEVLLPASTGIKDYGARMTDALRAIAEQEVRLLADVLESITGEFPVADAPARKPEIERRWLVRPGVIPVSALANRSHIEQGYLSALGASPVVRVRLERFAASQSIRAFQTVKAPLPPVGGQPAEGVDELEHAIPVRMATDLMAISLARVQKLRHRTPWQDGLVLELDVFEGAAAGLVIAEIEVPSLSHPLQIPTWFGPEITGNRGLSNVEIAFRPDSARALATSLLNQEHSVFNP